MNSELSLVLGRHFVSVAVFGFKSGKSLPVGSGDKTMSLLGVAVSGFHSGSC